MNRFKRLAVSLDLSSMDRLLVRYAAFLAKTMPLERIYFLHSMEIDPSTEWLPDYLPDGVDNLESLIREDMEDKVRTHFPDDLEAELSFPLLHGDATENILDWTRQEQVDILMLGKKSRLRGTGVYTGKIVRLAESAVWLVPESSPLSLDRILVPVDFSPYSGAALRNGQRLAGMMDADLHALHVTHLPATYFPAISPVAKLQEQFTEKAERNYARFVKELKLSAPVPPLTTLLEDGDGVAGEIYEYALNRGADLIVMGNKGRTNAASFLLGGVAERLALQDHHIPILVVKDKARHASLLDRWFS